MAADLAAAYSGPGSVVVRYGAVTADGFLDDQEGWEPDANGMMVPVRRRTLRVVAADFTTTPTRDSSITVDGTAYQVRSAFPSGDGKELTIVLVTT